MPEQSTNQGIQNKPRRTEAPGEGKETMDAQDYQEQINYITTMYVNQLVQVGHVPSKAAGLLTQEITEVVDEYLQPEPKTNKEN